MASEMKGASIPFAVVVNDDPTQLALLSGLVRKAGLEPRSFESAVDALALLDDIAAKGGALPSLVVTDLHMPVVDGWRFCHLLHSPEHHACNEIPIVVVSATFAGAETDQVAIDLGAEVFFSAPVEGKRFVEQVRMIVGGKRTRKAPRVLVVDGDVALTASLGVDFGANGYLVRTASTAKDASTAFATGIFDVAVLGHMLPDGRGDELLDSFLAQRPECVCLMTTDDPAPELPFEWMKKGAAATVRKPFLSAHLIELTVRARRDRVLLRVQEQLGTRTRQLHENEEHLKLALLGADLGTWDWNVDSGAVTYNERWAELFGHSLSEIEPHFRAFETRIHPDDKRRVMEAMNAHIEGRADIYEAEFRMRHKSGDWVWVLGKGRILERDAAGRPIRVCGTQLDISSRKRAEEALARERLVLWSVFEGAVDFLIFKDRDLVYRMVNPSLCAFHGKRIDEVVGRTDFDLFPREEAERYRAVDAEVMATGRPSMNEWNVPGAKGRRWLHVIKTAVRDGAGQVTGVLSTVRDVTERRTTEDLLRESRELMASTQRLAKVGGWEWDVSAQTMMWTDETYRIHDLEHGEVEPLSSDHIARSAECYGPEDRPVILAAFRRCVESGEPYDFEFPFTSAKGRKLWIRTAAQAVRVEGRIVKVVGHIMDVTEQKDAEVALRDSEERHRSLLQQLGVGVVVHGPDTSVVMANREASRFLGLSIEQMTGKQAVDPAWRFIREDGSTMPVEEYPVNRVLSSAGQISEMVVGVERSVDDRGWCIVNAYPEMGPDQKLSRIVVTFVDVTERKRSEEEKGRLEAQLQQAQKMESVGRLAGGVAHDFNNMLQAILGNVELAMEGMTPDDPMWGRLEEAHKCAVHSADLTRQLLAFARKQTVAPKVLDLNETVAGMLKMLERLIGEDIRLGWRPRAGLWSLKVDPSQIDQIMVNLCVNARDAIGGVGTVTIETGNVVIDEAYRAKHEDVSAGEYVLLRVTDDGCGMDKETLGHLFEPFFTTKGVGMGTGLGLSTVFGIVKQNDGFINVSSELGRGTTFSIHLPRYVSNVVKAAVATVTGPIMRGHETILLVEDEPGVLKLTTAMLGRLGYNVLAAGTPGEAIRIAREHHGQIDLLLSDVVMPEMNGRDLAKNMLALYPEIKRMFMSGYTADVIAHHGVLDSGVAFIQKPFSMKELAVRIRAALGG